MRPGQLLPLSLALAAPSALMLVGLVLGRWLAPGPAAVGFGLVFLGAIGLALLWRRDLERLTARLARLPGEIAEPILPGSDNLARAIERLTRDTTVRAGELDRRRRADPSILDHLPDPLIVLGPDRGTLRTNAAARKMLGTELPAVLRHPALRLAIDRAFAEGSVQGSAQSSVQDGIHSTDISLAVPVAREMHANVVMLHPPLPDGGSALVVLSDRSAERALDRMRADFVANASHELRTPLASLIGFIETLQGPAADDPPAQARFLAIMAEQSARMNRLIDDLLSLSRIELTEHLPPVDPVALAPLLARVAAGFEPRLAERGARLEPGIADELPAVIGDADQLAQVFQNLLDNAVKYGRSGGTIRLDVQPADSAGNWPARQGLVVSVSDDGIGIARTHLPRLTERFYRVDTGRSRAVGGTGLGLAIVKHIVNRHRGQLRIDSEEGKGTVVQVWLPIAA